MFSSSKFAHNVSRVLAVCRVFSGNHSTEYLADVIGCSPAVARNRFNPHNDTHHLTIGHVTQLACATGDVSIINAMANEAGCKVVPLEELPVEQTHADINGAVVDATVRYGAFVAQIQEALADGRVTQTERHEVVAKLDELQRVLDRLKLSEGLVK